MSIQIADKMADKPTIAHANGNFYLLSRDPEFKKNLKKWYPPISVGATQMQNTIKKTILSNLRQSIIVIVHSAA